MDVVLQWGVPSVAVLNFYTRLYDYDCTSGGGKFKSIMDISFVLPKNKKVINISFTTMTIDIDIKESCL